MNHEKIQKHVINIADPLQLYEPIASPRTAIVNHLLDDLEERSVGDYKIIIHPNLPGHTSIEFDLIVINKFGVFAIEIVDWRGTLVADDSYWMQGEYERKSPLKAIEFKVIYLQRYLNDIISNNTITVIPFVVLNRSTDKFIDRSKTNSNNVVGLDKLANLLSQPSSVLPRPIKELTDDEIANVGALLFKPRL